MTTARVEVPLFTEIRRATTGGGTLMGSNPFEVELDDRRRASRLEQTVWQAPFEEPMAPLQARQPSVLAGFLANLSVYAGVDRAIGAHIIDNPAFDVARQMTRNCLAARKAPQQERR